VGGGDVVGLGELGGVVVGGGEAHARHADTARAGDVGAAQVTDVEGACGPDTERAERGVEDALVRLRDAHLVGEELRAQGRDQAEPRLGLLILAALAIGFWRGRN